MSRCAVCSEKAYVNLCAHCDKKCCDTCKDAHCDILKREVSRVNNQIKRGIHRIEDALGQVERNQTQLKANAEQVVTEIDEIQRRLSNALKERTDYLKSSVDKYLIAEMRSLKDLKDNLDLEVTNMQSNSDLMEKNLDDGTKWDDVELMDCKDIFIKMMDWIRNYDCSNEEYNRKIRFTCHDTINDLAKKILEIGDLRMLDNKPKEDEFESRSSGLSRSKSDHRLVSEFRRQEESGSGSPPMRRRFGENRYSRESNKSRTNFGRFGAEDEEEDSTSRSGRFRSRFLRGKEIELLHIIRRLFFNEKAAKKDSDRSFLILYISGSIFHKTGLRVNFFLICQIPKYNCFVTSLDMQRTVSDFRNTLLITVIYVWTKLASQKEINNLVGEEKGG